MKKTMIKVKTEEVQFYFEQTFIEKEMWEVLTDFLNDKFGESKADLRLDIKNQTNGIWFPSGNQGKGQENG